MVFFAIGRREFNGSRRAGPLGPLQSRGWSRSNRGAGAPDAREARPPHRGRLGPRVRAGREARSALRGARLARDGRFRALRRLDLPRVVLRAEVRADPSEVRDLDPDGSLDLVRDLEARDATAAELVADVAAEALHEVEHLRRIDLETHDRVH